MLAVNAAIVARGVLPTPSDSFGCARETNWLRKHLHEASERSASVQVSER